MSGRTAAEAERYAERCSSRFSRWVLPNAAVSTWSQAARAWSRTQLAPGGNVGRSEGYRDMPHRSLVILPVNRRTVAPPTLSHFGSTLRDHSGLIGHNYFRPGASCTSPRVLNAGRAFADRCALN